ncbi:D-alanyl-D-alanine carboxypeptidase family protein [Shouchella clausii]|uniref:D-alanyl-D-alanine carboxypeptidase family protein n=1 Tax=Shouchella clausii TaxID=79880 RepID=UPI000BA519A4|nr:serine hydrolase [Shouchella clausii]PAD15341.1 D-alanyl-D-alanine carboxypeptidase [Shouchella clausii]
MGKAPTFVKISVIIMIIFVALFKVADKGTSGVKESFPFFRTDEYVSPYIYVMERETGRVVYEENAEAKVYPASLTKIMTTIVALEQIEDLSAIAPVDVTTYHEMVASNASMAGFFGREDVTYRDLLYGTMLTSGGEAANSLAVHVGGNVENFVQMMNDKAAELGLNTHFTNPEGLHNEKQYTTASDMAKLLDYALNNSDFKTIFTTKMFQTTPTAEHPDGLLLQSTVLTFLHKKEQDRFDILGGKSGTTYEAGQCWATLGLVEDTEYITIVMGAPLKDISHPDRAQIADTLKLYRKIESSE